ncbi:Na(+)/H(+) exchange regulatory cofactor NHE-RF3-like [Anomaloglossus baeobatrachus]|uniref:Na(+)/H(+) exchange regulatory cofactor NHE-RF3 n=1 Tax=Anomaloglossus baeobatrachus TaxID=238106 RepID=UPI003F4FA33F
MALDAKPRECSLTKPEGKGYGFFLRVEQDVPGHLIRSVESGSIADKAGLKDGDRVLKVNGKFVDDMEHTKVVEIIQVSGSSVTLTVQDEVSYLNSKKSPEKPSGDKATSGDKAPSGDKATPGHKAPTGEAATPKPRLCYLVKDKGSFGFSLKTNKGTKGFFLDTLLAGGVAVKAGVKEGDRIIEINGKNIEFDSYEQLVKKVKESGDSVMFLLADKETTDYFHQNKKEITAEVANLQLLPNPPRIVGLDRDADGYGFYLRQEKKHKGHFIVDIDETSSAHKAGLKEYDRIVAVNGESVEAFEHEQVVEAIQKGGNKTTLLISNRATDEIYAKAGISPFLYLKTSKTPTPNNTETPKPTETPLAKPAPAPTQVKPAATTASPDPKHKPRLCRLTKGSSGFGFNLNAIKDVPGQFLKQVVKGGPADVAGIKEDDFLVEVNGVNVEKEAYDDVVMKIKEAGGNITLLVVSQEAYEHFKAQNIKITSAMADPLPETNSVPPQGSNQKNPPNKAEPLPETKNSPPTNFTQNNPSSKAEPQPETNNPPPTNSTQNNPTSKAEPQPETKNPPPTSNTHNNPTSKEEPSTETNANQKTPPSKARSAPEPVEMETKTPEEPPKNDDDTAL